MKHAELQWWPGKFKISVITPGGQKVRREVKGFVSGLWGLQSIKDHGWNVTHLPTGFLIQGNLTMRFAKVCASYLAGMKYSWTESDWEQIPKKMLRIGRARVRKVFNEQKQVLEPKKKRGKKPAGA